jgi:energy-coupling factor transport system substrate-specific component
VRKTRAIASILSWFPIFIGSILGLLAFTWPLFIPESNFFLLKPEPARFLALFIAFLAVLVISVEISRGALDSKIVALLGVLAALIAALRLVGAGAVGVEPMWFLLIISSYIFGSKFGFSLGVISMAVSAVISGGIGPWLSFQMLAAGWIGLFAGSFSRKINKRFEIITLVVIGVFSSLLFGALMDLQLWPWIASTNTQLGFIPGAPLMENLSRYLNFHLATAMAWDIPRAITTAVLISLSARALLASLSRTAMRMGLTSPSIVEEVNA